jgi:hypothetical protein
VCSAPVAEWLACPLADRLEIGILQSCAGWRDRMQFDQLKKHEFITLLGAEALSGRGPSLADFGEQSTYSAEAAIGCPKNSIQAALTPGMPVGHANLHWSI